MEELIVFAGLVILIALPVAILTAILIFKRSFLTKIGIGISIIAAYAAVIGYIIAKLGLIHLTWGASSTILLMVIIVLVLRRDIHVLQLIRDDVEKMSNFDLRIPFTEKNMGRKDEMGVIVRSMKVMTDRLNEVVNEIQSNASELRNASMQLSEVSQGLSQNANEQAATTEEVATSMEEMLATIDSNTERAIETGSITTASANEMKASNEIFMQSIRSALEISKRVRIISEIAEKTDILSINASIEAARAGESGKGFAVVAQEIRKLADTTKNASEKITELSDNGQIISKQAGEKLDKTIPEILKSAEHVTNIVAASQEQQSGVGAISNAVQQLTEITNRNSSAAEEMSASAEELSERAERLNDLVSGFSTNDT